MCSCPAFQTLLCPALPLLPPATPTCQQQGQKGEASSERHWGPQNCHWVLCAVPVWQQLSNEWSRGVVQVRHGVSDLTATQWALPARLLPPRLAACTAQSWNYLQIPAAFKVCFILPEQRYPQGLVTNWFLSHTKEEGGFFKERLLKYVIRC